MSRVVKLRDKTIRKLQKSRKHPRETWDDLVNKSMKKEMRKRRK